MSDVTEQSLEGQREGGKEVHKSDQMMLFNLMWFNN